ncbi:MAG: hypothetical protein MZV64_59735 [Ignavibacteriales bacterium]|nr:hypothetical protein [Ignavibacteriales bacterium]
MFRRIVVAHPELLRITDFIGFRRHCSGDVTNAFQAAGEIVRVILRDQGQVQRLEAFPAKWIRPASGPGWEPGGRLRSKTQWSEIREGCR